jgi:uroporphyrinogen-III synthase
VGDQLGALHGRRVVVTRSSAQAGSLAGLLEAEGAVPVVVPLIEQVAVPEEGAALAVLAPSAFDWLVVSSPNGANHYVAAHGDAPPQVAAIGATTAAALAEGGVVASLIPGEQSAVGLLAEFPECVGAGRVLLVQASGAEPVLADGLRAKNWQVTVVAPYRTVPARLSAGVQLAALAADAVLFASGSAVRAWVDVFGTSTPPITVAIGPQTLAAADSLNLKISLVATDHSLKGLIAVLSAYLSSPS